MTSVPSPSLDRFVPRVACEWDLDAPGARWRELDGSLCFVDISGFTALSERLAMRGRIGVEELTDVLNRVFGTMLELAFERGGSLLKFGGDALLLLFDREDHPQQAAAAAVEMRAALRDATATPMSVGRVQLRMSVGLHSGTVQLFRVGGLHQELIITGPAATRTTQMEHAASAGEIFVSPEMADRLPPGATKPGPGGARILRWRKAPVPAPGPRSRRAVNEEAIEAWLPQILRAHLLPGGVEFEHRIAAVAFLRFRGVDALLASGGPDAVAEALHGVVSTVQQAADDAGVAFLASDIDEDGGKVILVSGVPRAQPDHEGRLLRALRSIVDAAVPLPLQIGVNDGHVFAGTIGARHRATYTVMGDTVNLAARLMSAASAGELFATPGVLDRARPMFATRALEPFAVKGKAQLVQAYAVGDEVGTRADVDHQGPFIGRGKELAQVSDAVRMRTSVQGEPVLTIVGATGGGKSRLVGEALARTGVHHFTVRGEPDGTTSSYRTFRDALRALLGVERADRTTMASRLAAAVERIAPDLLPMLPLIGDVAHVQMPPTPEVQALEHRFLPDQRAAAIERLLDRTFADALSIVVEDAQWTDGASDELLTRLASAARQRPGWSMLVVRRDASDGFLPSGAQLEVGPLDDADVRELLAALTSVPLRPNEVDRLVVRAAGNPLVLSVLVRLGRERGAVDDLPDSLESLIAAEIDVLSPFPRLLLGYASVLGRSFNPLVWRQLLTEDGIEVADGAVAALKGFIHFDPAGSARFRQDVVRDVSYRSLPYRRRRELHLRAGLVMEHVAADAVDSVADLLSLHFFEGGDLERAWKYSQHAGASAQASYANNDAAALYRRALEAARKLGEIEPEERLDTWTALGDVLEKAGLLEDALDAYRRATALARDDDVKRAQILLKRARTRERSGAFVLALRELRSAERALDAHPEGKAAHVRLTAATMRGKVHLGQEQNSRALATAHRAAEEASRLGDLHELAEAYMIIDWAHVALGQPDLAVHQSRIVEIQEALGDPHRLASALSSQGAIHYWLGEWTDAVDCYRRSHDAYAKTGDVVNAAVLQSNIAELLINRGQLVAARDAILEAAQTHRAVGYVEGILFDEIQLGRLLLAEGDAAGAVVRLAAIVEEASGLSLHVTALEAAVRLAESHVAEGRPEAAMQLLADAEEAAGSEGSIFEPSVALVRARALVLMGDLEGAQQQRADGIASARRMDLPYELGLLLVGDEDPTHREEGRALLTMLEVDAPSDHFPSRGSSMP